MKEFIAAIMILIIFLGFYSCSIKQGKKREKKAEHEQLTELNRSLEVFKTAEGVNCVILNHRAISCDWQEFNAK